MSFLAPLFLLGALAVALPLLFHLIRRSSRERVPFSSLMFLVPTPPRVTRRSRIENWFLLLLRCLVICLLAFAFARPFLSRPAAMNAASQSSHQIILLIDTSASMRRGNLWAQTLDRANAVLRTTSPADQVACFTFDRTAKAIVTFDEWSKQSAGERAPLVGQRLASITPAWASTHLGQALIAATEAFDNSHHEEATRRIILITDLQEGSRLDGLQGYEWPRNLQVAVETVTTPNPSNAGLQLVADRENVDNSPSGALPRLRISNSSDSKREQFQVGWRNPNAPGTLASAADVYVPRGQSRIFTAPKPPGAGFNQLAITGDDHDFDNTVFYAPPLPQIARVLFLGNDDSKDPAHPLFYVQRAFQNTRRLDVQLVARNTASPLFADDLQDAALLIIGDSLPDSQIQSAKLFLENGGTALMPLATLDMAATLSRLLESSDIAADEARPANYSMLAQINFEHPLFAPFADPRFSDFTKIHFWNHRRVNLDSIQDAQIAARFDNGDAALAQIPLGRGTLFVLTSGWHPADSQLALSSKFVPLLYSVLDQSGQVKDQRSQYFVGDTVALPSGPKVTLIQPNGSEVEVQTVFHDANQPGIYAAKGDSALRFAVNLAPEESRTAPMPIEDLQRVGVPLKDQQPNTVRPGQQQRQQHLLATELESRQKLWRWVIVAALAILFLETCLAGRLTRRTIIARGQS
jgi:hypothetical protein